MQSIALQRNHFGLNFLQQVVLVIHRIVSGRSSSGLENHLQSWWALKSISIHCRASIWFHGLIRALWALLVNRISQFSFEYHNSCYNPCAWYKLLYRVRNQFGAIGHVNRPANWFQLFGRVKPGGGSEVWVSNFEEQPEAVGVWQERLFS